MGSSDHKSTWWLTPLPAVFEALGASGEALTRAEVGTRLKRYGPNAFRERPHFFAASATRWC